MKQFYIIDKDFCLNDKFYLKDCSFEKGYIKLNRTKAKRNTLDPREDIKSDLYDPLAVIKERLQ